MLDLTLFFLGFFGICLGLMFYFGVFNTQDNRRASTGTHPELRPRASTNSNASQHVRPVAQIAVPSRVGTSFHDHSPSRVGATNLASGLLAEVIQEDGLDYDLNSGIILSSTAPVESCQETQQATDMGVNICTTSQESPCYDPPSYDPPDTPSYSDSGTCSDTSFGSSDD